MNIDEGFLEKRHMTIEGQIIRFLIAVNRLLDGVHLEETSEMQSTLVKFEATLTCPYASPMYWSPTDLFHKIISDSIYKYFGIDDTEQDLIGYNNTNTVFWIPLDNIQNFVVHENCKHMINNNKNEKAKA